MESINNKRRVGTAAETVLLMVVASLGVEAGGEVTPPAPRSPKACYGACYPTCHVSNRLWCATLCLGKCNHGKSIPDNLCNCTYTCSKFRCADVGSDPEKVQRCVFQCSKLRNVRY